MKKLLFTIAMFVLVTTSAFAQNCLRVLEPTKFVPDLNGTTYSLIITYETDGNKTLETTVYCGTSEIFSDCFQAKAGPGTKTYSGLVCPGGLSQLSAKFITRTGSCNSAQCSVQYLKLNVLPVKFKSVKATNLGKGLYKVYFEVDEEINIDKYIIKLSNDGGKTFKEKTIIFADGSFSKGTYEATIKL